MKVLRRSLNKDRISPPTASPTFPPGSGPSPSPYPTQPFASLSLAAHPGRLAKQAPSKVIRAIASYRARAVTELSFEAGDFFHVEGERESAPGATESGWYEASNPATGARGLVPRSYFQVLGRSARDTPSPKPLNLAAAGSGESSASGKSPNGSVVSARSAPSMGGFPFPPATAPVKSPNGMVMPLPSPAAAGFGGARTPGGNPPKSAGLSKSQPLYGIVQYDFRAERNDELDAKKGEPIIVIAQSNHEWFVAKPIGRLGGPGLIPVAFVQVQDVNTNKPMQADKVEDLIRSGTVPRVEDWKKATAAYKGNSIPLGRFDFPSAASGGQQQGPGSRSQASTPGASQPPSAGYVTSPTSPNAPQSAQSQPPTSAVPRSHSRQQSAGGRQVTSNYETQAPSLRTSSATPNGASSAMYAPQHPSHSSPALGTQPSPTNVAFSDTSPPGAQPMDGEDEENYATVEELRLRYGVIVHASVESFHFEQGHYWFHLRAHFSRPLPSDPSQDDVTILVLYRLYQDFYDFQIALMDAFPVEAGRIDKDGNGLSQAEGAKRRILPMMPGPADHVDELVCAQRVQDLSAYLGELAQLPLYIRECELVYELLGPREGDVELEGNPNLPQQDSAAAEGEVVEYLEKMAPSTRESDSFGPTGARGYSTGSQPPGSRGSGGRTSANYAASSGSSARSPPGQISPLSERGSGAPPSSQTSSMSSQQAVQPPKSGGALAAAQQQGFLRIKIYQRRTDDLIAIRVPTSVSHAQLLERVREKVGPSVATMRFRDEGGQGYATGGTPPVAANGARLVALDNDDDLQRWLEAGSRMVLYTD